MSGRVRVLVTAVLFLSVVSSRRAAAAVAPPDACAWLRECIANSTHTAANVSALVDDVSAWCTGDEACAAVYADATGVVQPALLMHVMMWQLYRMPTHCHALADAFGCEQDAGGAEAQWARATQHAWLAHARLATQATVLAQCGAHRRPALDTVTGRVACMCVDDEPCDDNRQDWEFFYVLFGLFTAVLVLAAFAAVIEIWKSMSMQSAAILMAVYNTRVRENLAAESATANAHISVSRLNRLARLADILRGTPAKEARHARR